MKNSYRWLNYDTKHVRQKIKESKRKKGKKEVPQCHCRKRRCSCCPWLWRRCCWWSIRGEEGSVLRNCFLHLMAFLRREVSGCVKMQERIHYSMLRLYDVVPCVKSKHGGWWGFLEHWQVHNFYKITVHALCFKILIQQNYL